MTIERPEGDRKYPVISGGSIEAPVAYSLTVDVPGRGKVVIPDAMGESLWEKTVKTIVAYFGNKAKGVNVTAETRIFEELKADSMDAVESVMDVESMLAQETGQKIKIQDPLADVIRKVGHVRDAYNIIALGDVDVANGWIDQRVTAIETGGGKVEDYGYVEKF